MEINDYIKERMKNRKVDGFFNNIFDMFKRIINNEKRNKEKLLEKYKGISVKYVSKTTIIFERIISFLLLFVGLAYLYCKMIYVLPVFFPNFVNASFMRQFLQNVEYDFEDSLSWKYQIDLSFYEKEMKEAIKKPYKEINNLSEVAVSTVSRLKNQDMGWCKAACDLKVEKDKAKKK